MRALRESLRENIWENKLAGKAEHTGLLLQRYLKDQETGDGGESRARTGLFETALKAQKKALPLYEKCFEEWQKSFFLTNDFCGAVGSAETKGRMIIGLGTQNVLEAGIALHHLYGMPYLPGSALKGLAAHYCHTVWGSWDDRFCDPEALPSDVSKEAGSFFCTLFGTTEESGIVCFHDALIAPECLEKEEFGIKHDTLTPHHSDYYGGKKPYPTDFDDPVPVSFLSVTGVFRLFLTCNGEDAHGYARSWVKMAWKILKEALEEWGIGGKTSSGYGRMSVKIDKPPKPSKEEAPEDGGVDTSLTFAVGDEITVIRQPDKIKKGKKGKGDSTQIVFKAPNGWLCMLKGGMITEGVKFVDIGGLQKAKITKVETEPKERYFIELL